MFKSRVLDGSDERWCGCRQTKQSGLRRCGVLVGVQACVSLESGGRWMQRCAERGHEQNRSTRRRKRQAGNKQYGEAPNTHNLKGNTHPLLAPGLQTWEPTPQLYTLATIGEHMEQSKVTLHNTDTVTGTARFAPCSRLWLLPAGCLSGPRSCSTAGPLSAAVKEGKPKQGTRTAGKKIFCCAGRAPTTPSVSLPLLCRAAGSALSKTSSVAARAVLVAFRRPAKTLSAAQAEQADEKSAQPRHILFLFSRKRQGRWRWPGGLRRNSPVTWAGGGRVEGGTDRDGDRAANRNQEDRKTGRQAGGRRRQRQFQVTGAAHSWLQRVLCCTVEGKSLSGFFPAIVFPRPRQVL